MDNSKGGYVIIDISKLALAETESATVITEASVLKQLLGLSIYGLSSDLKLKPIYLRALDENGKEVVALCELERDSDTLVIRAEILGHSLEIIVTYDVDNDTQEVIIDTATYEYIADSEVTLSSLSDKDVKVKTIKQSEPSYLGSVSVKTNTTGLTYIERYCRSIEINNVLFIVLSYTLKNETDASISAGQIQLQIDVGEENGQHIYTISGKPLSDPAASAETICSFEMKRGTTFSNSINTYLFRNNASSISVWVQTPSLEVGAREQFEGRIFLTLL